MCFITGLLYMGSYPLSLIVSKTEAISSQGMEGVAKQARDLVVKITVRGSRTLALSEHALKPVRLRNTFIAYKFSHERCRKP
jgi:hypothetical protein